MSAAAPDITVVIPTRNRCAFLTEAIASVEAQRGPSTEIVVVDDASTDDTPAILAGAGPHVRTLRLTEHRERSAARNTGLEAARGAFVLFLDDDDRLADTALAALLSPLSDPAIVASVGGFERVRGDEVVKVGAHPSRRVVRDVWTDVLLGWVGTLGRSLLRTSTLREIGAFDEKISYGEDWEMWLRLALRGRVALVPDRVLRYRVHAGQTQEDDWRAAEADIIDRHLASVPDDRREIGERVVMVRRRHEQGIDKLRAGNARAALGDLAGGLRSMPSLYLSPLQRRRMLSPLLRATARAVTGRGSTG